jgi:glycosyltransferase involved in cell wall biosynthesis
MKVALYFFRLSQSSGGAERMLVMLARSLADRGHEVHVVSWDPPGSVAFYELPGNVQWHQLGFAPGRWDKWRRTVALARVLSRTGCDVFVGFVMSADKTVYAGCLLARVPIVVAERNSPDMYRLKFGPATRDFYMRLLRLASKVVVQIEDYRAGYPAWLRPRIEVIPNPVRQATRTAEPGLRREEAWTLLSVGRLDPQKNHDALIRAFGQVAGEFPDWRLRIAGEGALRPNLTRLVEQLALGGRVQLAGAIEDVDSEYANSHLFCLASRWEGFPNALAEAMAHGLPVVGYAGCPGVNSLVEHGQDGLLAPGNGDVATLAEALRRLMGNPAERRDFGRNSQRIAQRFDAAQIARQWERVIAQSAGVTADA